MSVDCAAAQTFISNIWARSTQYLVVICFGGDKLSIYNSPRHIIIGTLGRASIPVNYATAQTFKLQHFTVSLGGLFLFCSYIYLSCSVILSSNICVISFMCFSFVLFTDTSVTLAQPFTEASRPLKGEYNTTKIVVIH